MLILLGLGFWAAAVVVFVRGLAESQTSRKPGSYRSVNESTATSTFDPAQLAIGTGVSYRGVDYVVGGTVAFRQDLHAYGGALVWRELRLDGGTTPAWLSVVRDEGRLEVLVWTPRNDLDLRPFGTQVVDGETYRDGERGRASYLSRGDADLPTSGIVEFVDYANADHTKFLGFRRWAPGRPREIRTGCVADVHELTTRPGGTGSRPQRPGGTSPSPTGGRRRGTRRSARRPATPSVWRKRFTSSRVGVVLHGLGQVVLQQRRFYRSDPRDRLFGFAGLLAIAGTFCLFLLAAVP